MSVLKVTNLSFSYKNQVVLSDINFSLNNGEVICVLVKMESVKQLFLNAY